MRLPGRDGTEDGVGHLMALYTLWYPVHSRVYHPWVLPAMSRAVCLWSVARIVARCEMSLCYGLALLREGDERK